MELQKWKIFQHLDPIFAADIKRAYLVGISSLPDDDEDSNDEDDEDNSPYTGGVMIMRNDDVYFITRDSKDLRLRGERASREFLPFVPVKIDGLCGQQIQAVNSGAHHVVALTTEGRMYQWGHIYIEERKKIKFKPQFLSGDGIENKRVVQIACGQDHSLALTSEGDVFSWGSNRYGQLGTGRATYEISPTKISGLNGFESKISTVACSGWNSFALDKDDGSVWSWGDGDDCLGHDLLAPQMTPLKMPLVNIKMIAAGNTHVLTLSDRGQLCFWGQHAPNEFRVDTPRLVEVRNVVAIGATRGASISACKTAKGKVYYWGVAYGHFDITPLPTRFKTIPELFKSLDIPIMLEPLTFELTQPITEKLKLSFDDKETGDVRFKVEGKVIFAHSMILKLRSDHFGRMFDHNWKENDEKEVEIADFTYQGFRTFLLYLYTDRIDPPPRIAEDAIELFKLADYYGEEDLKGRCEQQLKVLITEGNVSKIYAASFQYNTKALHDMALDFIIPNLNDVVKTEEYRKMSDDLKNRLIQELAEEHILVGLKRKRRN